jgi:hypothetical protein
MQFSSHDMFPLHPWTHVMMLTHAMSWAHVCVTEQHLDWTQLAHWEPTNAIPQAAIVPPPLPEPPLPDPLPLPVEVHALLQLC